ncbi:hypothetical protein Hanom_Chr00s000004g01608551 [Helianthus anomalus]
MVIQLALFLYLNSEPICFIMYMNLPSMLDLLYNPRNLPFYHLIPDYSLYFIVMFGQEAAKMLDYGECPDGFKIGTPLSQECKEVKIRGFPMWVINMTSGRSFGC